MGADLRGPPLFLFLKKLFGNQRHKRDHGEHRESAPDWFPGIFGKCKGLQRSKNRHASEPRVANFSLQVGHCMGERGGLWRELFGHGGADHRGFVQVVNVPLRPVKHVPYKRWFSFIDMFIPVLEKKSWLHKKKVRNMRLRPALKTCVLTCQNTMDVSPASYLVIRAQKGS